jgi:hypothetical protein
MKNLQSSASKVGKNVTQIVGFIGGEKKTWHDVATDTIEEGTFTKFKTNGNRLVMVHTKNVLWVEVFGE